MLATCAADFRAAKSKGKVAMMLITQAADMIGSDLKRVGIMHRLGFRILGMCYTFANLVGDGCGERRNAGVSFLGRDLIAAVNELPMMLDISHSGHQTSLESVELARRPCATHANAYAVVANDRNKKDEVLKIIKEKGGVIGLCGLAALGASSGPHARPHARSSRLPGEDDGRGTRRASASIMSKATRTRASCCRNRAATARCARDIFSAASTIF